MISALVITVLLLPGLTNGQIRPTASRPTSTTETTTIMPEFIIRLQGGSGRTEGRLEVSKNGSVWGTVCDSFFSTSEALVVCKELKYKWGNVVGGATYGEGSGPIFLDTVMCQRVETRLSNCYHQGWGSHNCDHSQDVGVKCSNSSVMLGSSININYGTIKMETSRGWTAVCDNNWDDKDARVACRELGYVDGIAQKGSKFAGVTSLLTFRSITNVNCTGEEDHLTDCKSNLRRAPCPYRKRASVICYEISADNIDKAIKFRLNKTKRSDNWGRVEVRYLGVWGQICSDNFGDTAANIVCKGNGYAKGVAYGSASIGSGPVWLSRVACQHNETRLEDCVKDRSDWGKPVMACGNAHVLCYNRELTVSLVDGGINFGRVQIKYDGQVGSICDSRFSSNDAKVICQSLNYTDGQYFRKSYYGPGTGQIWMNGLVCDSSEKSVFQCKNNGWNVYQNTYCANHSRDSSVFCVGPVRLYRGGVNHGIVQISNNNQWYTLCGTGFDDKDAKVVCGDLGFKFGKKLQRGTYGRMSNTFKRPYIKCVGNESSVFDCPYSRGLSCNRWSSRTNYAAVSCYNDTSYNGPVVKIDNAGTGYETVAGRVLVYHQNLWGSICNLYWDDKDANVVCRELNFTGGVAMQYAVSSRGPYVLSQVDCNGNETSILNCPRRVQSCATSSTNMEAGVLCYNTEKPRIRLVGGDGASGRVEIVYENQVGTICNQGWGSADASVLCSMLGYVDGEIRLNNYPAGTGAVFMNQVRCSGAEQSIFQCRSQGWGIAVESCLDHSRDAEVFCYRNVRVTGGSQSVNYTTGRAQVYLHGSWGGVCADKFDNSDAHIVCRELNFNYGIALSPGLFGRYYQSRMITNVNCSGSEKSVLNCGYTEGRCRNSGSNYATVACSKDMTEQGMKAYLAPMYGRMYAGEVTIERYGTNGTICADSWDDNDAKVLCRQLGYAGGRALGRSYSFYSSSPIWISDLNCTGKEMSIFECPHKKNPNNTCTYSYNRRALALCYQQKLEIRLQGGGSSSSGRVEIAFDGVWGSVCDNSWNTYDARVVCKQLGFLDGTATRNSQFGPGRGPVWMNGLQCNGDETSLFSCANGGWNRTIYSCIDHEDDAGAICYGRVRLLPNDTIGALMIYDEGRLSLVCDQNFDNTDATVVCKHQGYLYGKAVGGSAFGRIVSPLTIANMSCPAGAETFESCKYDKVAIGTGCPSKSYASVVCRNEDSTFNYKLRLSEKDKGTLEFQYWGHWGYICSNGFDDMDAAVICHELQFTGGYAYNQTSNRGYSYDSKIVWLTNVTCRGNEQTLEHCGNAGWGKVSGCNTDSIAGVVCYSNKGFQVRLANGSATHGRVEIGVDGKWGTVCGYGWTDDNAAVLCRSLNFTSGRAIGNNYFGSGSGQVWIDDMDCKGTEENIRQCKLSGFGAKVSPLCESHTNDAGVYCYDTVRLSGGPSVNYGRLDVYRNGTWGSVCDEGFDDKSAHVVCRQLGYVDGRAQCCSALGFKPRVEYARLSNWTFKCMGTEKSILSCPLTERKCRKGQYVSIFCIDKNITSTTETQLRIPGGEYYGVLEANRYGIWGPICEAGWDDDDATVACRQMGYLGGVAAYGTTTSTAPVLLGGFNCTSSEAKLSNCSSADLAQNTGCSYYNRGTGRRSTARAGVMCYNHAAGVNYRINGGTETKGRAEINFAGTWGTVCDSLWGNSDARVFCRSVGFVDGTSRQTAYTGQASGRVWMNNLMCKGNETSLLRCRATWTVPRSSYCNSHRDDAGVECYKPVRLVRGDASYGRLEVFRDNVWSAVCDNSWEDRDAEVTCKELGFEHGISICCGALGYNFRRAIMDYVNCNGSETSLSQCPHQSPDTRCYRLDYASAACYNGARPTKYSSLSINGGSNYTGDIIVSYMNISGRICSDDWDDNDAIVACRELGFSRGQAYQHYRASYVFTNYYGPYWTSNVNCTGNENSFGQCGHIGWGSVSKCLSRHHAGVLCYNNHELSYRLVGTNNNYGRVEVRVNGEWGSVCNSFWDTREASVFCKQLGYNGGEPLYSGSYGNKTGPVWDGRLRCVGNESSLNDCPHEGWKKVSTFSSCRDHRRDAAVYCYGPVRLSTGRTAKHGPLLLYHNASWVSICDSNFNDYTARKSCQSLGYVDGRSVCCSGYGAQTYQSRYPLFTNKTLSCSGNERTVKQCIRDEPCTDSNYASVVCFAANDTIIDDYKFTIEATHPGMGQIVVTHFNISGRICNTMWDDRDAMVMCRSQGYQEGIAYHHSNVGMSVSSSTNGPYWVGELNCTGEEKSLADCPFDKSIKHGNCSKNHIASVLCYNGSGIEYRMVGRKNYGRVDMKLLDTWGTVCDSYWDNREADVFCRQMNFSGGAAMRGARYGSGSGPIWLSHLQCKGNETSLHQCPHRGFNSSYSDYPFGIIRWLYGGCSSHAQDASVYCYGSTRLTKGPNATMGGVEIFHDNRWNAICDKGFSDKVAGVVCRGLNFTGGKAIPNSAFGNITSRIGIASVTCRGIEDDIMDCDMDYESNCSSGNYASVFCGTITQSGFNLRLSEDRLSGSLHGIVEAQIDGLWGRVCMAGWNEAAANVTCKSLGHKGGNVYLHIVKNTLPIIIKNVNCTGQEKSLKDCQFEQWGDTSKCKYGDHDAGVLCYNRSGIQYRLVGSSDSSMGRVEIAHDGIWGSVCDYAWNQPDAKVMCRTMGYVDGQALTKSDYVGGTGPIWVNGFFCKGKEPALMSCLSAGWNTTFLSANCRSHSRDAAVRCFNQTLKASDVRFVGGDNKTYGRVEVYVQGANEWGTVCDDLWDDIDATVVCQQKGFAKGVARTRAAFGRGSGTIWFDNIRCNGTETMLWDCEHRGLGVHNCQHYEDASVMCSGVLTTTTVPMGSTKTTQRLSTASPPEMTRAPPTKTTIHSGGTPSPQPETPAPTPQPTTLTKPSTSAGTKMPEMTTTANMTEPSSRGPETRSSAGLGGSSIAAAVVVPILLLLIGIIVAVVIYRYRKSGKNQFKHERFDDKNIHFKPSDDTVSYGGSNLYDIPLGAAPEMNGGGNGIFGHADGNGNAVPGSSGMNGVNGVHGSPGSNGSIGFDNPLYAESTAGDPAMDITLAERDEVIMPHSIEVSRPPTGWKNTDSVA